MSGKAAAIASKLCRMAARCDDRRLFDRHRDQIIAIIDLEMCGETERESVNTNDVFDKAIRKIGGQAAVGKCIKFGWREVVSLAQERLPLRHALRVKPRKRRRVLGIPAHRYQLYIGCAVKFYRVDRDCCQKLSSLESEGRFLWRINVFDAVELGLSALAQGERLECIGLLDLGCCRWG